MEPTQISSWESFRLHFACSGSCGVIKVLKRAVLGTDKAPLGPQRMPRRPGTGCVPKGIISMEFNQTECFVMFRTFLGCHEAHKSFSPSKALFYAKWNLLGPLWIPKRIKGGPICLTIMYYTCETCFRAIWTLPEHHRVHMLISARWAQF